MADIVGTDEGFEAVQAQLDIPEQPVVWGWSLYTHKITQQRELAPNLDTHSHAIGAPCWCHPWVDATGLMVHNSHDGRERYEIGAARPH